MANCPRCNSKLPFFKVGFLSNAWNGIVCSSCDAFMKADKVELAVIGSSGGVLGLLIMNWAYGLFRDGNTYWYIGVLATILYFLIVIYLQNFILKFHISKKTKHQEKIDQKMIYEGPIPNKLDKPIEHLKYLYKDYNESELKEILKSGSYREEAVLAAKQLLNEKYNA